MLMRTYDFTPLYRSAVGFDRLASLLENASRATSQDTGYPPYNIETTGENAYRIEIAVAGFSPDELNIEVKENLLTVTGRKTANDDTATQKTYLHRGLAERDFERRFQLADYVVVNDANLVNGLLSISLKRELPEALKPLRERPPTPGVELDLVVGRQIDLGFVAGEAEGEPLLLLTLETAPGLGVVHGFGREVVQDPVVRPRQQFDRGDAGLLMQFAAGGRFQILARIDAALRELPVMRAGRSVPLAVPDQALAVEQHDPDIGPIGVEIGH
jgi:molecular chaperone IbpA